MSDEPTDAELIIRAHQLVRAICREPKRDADLIISALLNRFEKQANKIAELEAEVAMLRAKHQG